MTGPVPRVRVFPDADAATIGAVEEWSRALARDEEEAVVLAAGAEPPNRRVLLAGGRTPERLDRKLAEPASIPRAEWRRVEGFFGDERCLPPDHPDSNYGLVRRALLDPLREDAPKVHRMRGEHRDLDAAALEYERALVDAFRTVPEETPSFDLALLGVGEDGHTASLFPGRSIDPDRLCVATTSPEDGSPRLTVTLRLLDAARHVLFFVLGASKANAVARCVGPDASPPRELHPRDLPRDPPPAALVRPRHGRVVWILDQGAARELRA
ncbi:MAG TPA: 6-phosphogluconolactonase [Candidatus Eisenbacteria bacterium]|nr:6-phosphogluconolactonase [Candidatus Eisenbacteria bacterium]